MKEQDISALKESAISTSVNWAKTGFGYFTMREKVNDYMEVGYILPKAIRPSTLTLEYINLLKN